MTSHRSKFFAILLLFGCDSFLGISGITETGPSNPDPIGKVDESDWCFGPLGVEREFLLFPAYPNPAYEGVTFQFSLTRDFFVKLRVIDDDSKVVMILLQRFLTGSECRDEGDGPLGCPVYSVHWNLLNEKGVRVRYGLYRVQIFIDGELRCKGDIRVKSR